MRIAIVNDMVMAVEVLRRVISGVSDFQIAWIAVDGREAVEKCKQDPPDLILMDLIMPVMDGVEATRRIMKDTPCAILVVTVSVGENLSKVFEAMGYGALDAVDTPVLGLDGRIDGAEALIKKINIISILIGQYKKPRRIDGERTQVEEPVPKLVAIGSSTGGPKVLADIFSNLPKKLDTAFIIIQHVDVQFAPALVTWLDEMTLLTVVAAAPDSIIRPGVVLVAVTNDHLVMCPDKTVMYTVDPEACPYRPSVDTFFQSLLQYWPSRHLAVLLTGMGDDGAKGLLALRRAGWHTIAQDEETSVIYGMPKVARELGAASEILPPQKITERIIQFADDGR